MSTAYVGKPIGARRLTMWPLLTDPEVGVATYGPAARLSRLIQIVITPVFAEGLLESDDGVEDETSLVIAYDVTINASQLTDTIRAALLGHELDASGGILTTSTDQAPEVAIAWEELLSAKTGTRSYKKTVLYKGRFKEMSETANSVVQSGVTYQTHNLTARFYPRNDGALKYSLREDTPGADAAKLANWFTVPQEAGSALSEAVEAITATPAAGAVAGGTNVALSTATSGAQIRYTVDGTAPHAGSREYDGPITVSAEMTIKAIAYKAGLNPSPVFTAAYTLS